MRIRCNAKSARTICVGTTIETEDGKEKPGQPRKITIAPGQTVDVDKDLIDVAKHKDRGPAGLVVQAWFDTGELVETKGAITEPEPKGRGSAKKTEKATKEG
ncbi:MAG: hypothetical protein V3V08_05495 [Nannocystaceae bacterium]